LKEARNHYEEWTYYTREEAHWGGFRGVVWVAMASHPAKSGKKKREMNTLK